MTYKSRKRHFLYKTINKIRSWLNIALRKVKELHITHIFGDLIYIKLGRYYWSSLFEFRDWNIGLEMSRMFEFGFCRKQISISILRFFEIGRVRYWVFRVLSSTVNRAKINNFLDCMKKWSKKTQKLVKTKNLFISAPEHTRTDLSVFLDWKSDQFSVLIGSFGKTKMTIIFGQALLFGERFGDR